MKSFFSKITSSRANDEDFFSDVASDGTRSDHRIEGRDKHPAGHADAWSTEDAAGELSVDVYQTSDYIVIKAFVAGVQPSTVDISLTREMVTISGSRQDEKEVEEDGYFQKELFWGAFSRTILLPEEVDVDMAEASEKHGVLMLRLPKINKKRQTKLKVRSR
jgi:HSP20 family protein